MIYNNETISVKPDTIVAKLQNDIDKRRNAGIDYSEQLLKYHLITHGKIFLLPVGFNFGVFLNNLEKFFKKNDLNYTVSNIEEISRITFFNKKQTLKKTFNIDSKFDLFLYTANQRLYLDIKPADWFDNNQMKAGFSLKKIFNDSFDDQIENFVVKFLIDTLANTNQDVLFCDDNIFVKQCLNYHKIAIQAILEPDEVVCAFLPVKNVLKIYGKQYTNDEKSEYYFLQTSKQAALIAFKPDNDISKIYNLPANAEIAIKTGLKQNTLTVSDFQIVFSGKYTHDYKKITTVYNNADYEKIRFIALENFFARNKKSVVEYLLKKAFDLSGDTIDKLTLLYVNYLKNADIEDINDEQKDELIDLIKNIIADTQKSNYIATWFDTWKVETDTALIFIEIANELAQNTDEYLNILTFHTPIRNKYVKKTKDKINIILADINYCKNLINAGKNAEAIKIIKKRIKELPDETITDILPPQDLDVTGKSSGQVLKVKLYDLLAQAEKDGNKAEILKQLAFLQPLVAENLQKISAIDTNISPKTLRLEALLKPEALSEPAVFDSYKPVKSPITKDFAHKYLLPPAARRKNFADNLQKWIAGAKTPDLKLIKSYSEKVHSNNYKEIFDIISDIRYALGLGAVEVYIARGEKSVGITAYEGKPAFLIIGWSHIDKNSNNYLTEAELRFAIASELAYLFFDYAKISSSDVWKGAMDKGLIIIDTLLGVLPVASTVGKSLKQVGKLNAVAKIFEQAEKINNNRDIIDLGISSLKTLKKGSEKDESKEKNLLFASRILQLTADRVGLCFARLPEAALRAIFLTSPLYSLEFDVVKRYGLSKFLLQKDDKNNYKYQNLAIRVANMFSFYISEEFDIVEKQLFEEKN